MADKAGAGRQKARCMMLQAKDSNVLCMRTSTTRVVAAIDHKVSSDPAGALALELSLPLQNALWYWTCSCVEQFSHLMLQHPCLRHAIA